MAEVNRQQREAIAASPTPDAPDDRKRLQVPASLLNSDPPGPTNQVPIQPVREHDGVPLPARISAVSPQDDHQNHVAEPTPVAPSGAAGRAQAAPAERTPKVSPKPETPAVPKQDEPKPPAQTETREAAAKLAPPRRPEDGAEVVEVHESDRAPAGERLGQADDRGWNTDRSIPLGMGEPQLCRRVLGFGSFEPLRDERVKVGQHLLIYCELTGIQYEERGTDFVSRISSRVEVKPAEGGTVLWSRALGDAQDVCRHPRRDYYVNFVFDLPKTLGPGSYRLRLLQTDLVAGNSTSSEIPLEITR